MSLPRIKKRQSPNFWRYLKQSIKFLEKFLRLFHFAFSSCYNLATKVSQVVHRKLSSKGTKLHHLSKFLLTTFTAFIFTIFFSGIAPWFTAPAFAAANLTITPISWNILGLDSNNVTVGPNVFMVGARVCNTGADPATNIVVKFRKDGVNSYINLQNSDTVTIPSLPSGSTSASQTRPPAFYGSTPNNCSDAYYNIVVTRTSAAYDTKVPYHIEAVADNAGMVSTPLNHELYVEKLVSQNRNAVRSITGPATVAVGQTYQYTVTGSTATGGYEQLVFSPDFPNTLFQVLAVSATYTSPTGARNNSIYADACGWTNDPTSRYYHNNLACDNPAILDGYAGAKAGNDVTTIYTVKILSAGSASITNLIYDFSGSSYHYNSDFGSGVNAITITAVNPSDLTLVKSHTGNFTRGSNGIYTLVAKNSGSSATTGTVTVSDTLPTGLTPTAASGSGWTCNISGQTVTCTRSDTLAAGSSYSVINLTAAVAANAPNSVTNTATVSGGGQTNTTNDSASDPTTINGGPDLTATKSHTGNFTQGQTGAIYILTATNSGTTPTTGTVTLTDTLPTGLTATSASGTGWTCSVSGQTVTCTRSDALAAGASYPAITLNVTVGLNISSNITNTASVAGGGETNTNNNTASDPTGINLAVTTTISGTLYRDSDGGDDFDSGEPALPANITVKLLDSSGVITIATTTTNASGQYTFSGVVNGTYRIQVDTTDTDIPTGFTLGTPNNLSVTVSGSAITGQNFGFDAPVASSCSIGGGTPDGAIAPYISAEVRSDTITSRNVVDTLDDNWRTAANAPLSGTVQPWFRTNNSPGTLTSFTYRDPSTAANISTTVELVDVAISGADTCAGQSSSSLVQLDNNNALQDTAPRPASLYNSANQPLFWNQTGAGVNSKRAAVRFTFAQPVKSFGAWFGDLETRSVGATPAILRLLDASGNRIGSDIIIQPTDVYENSTTATPIDQNLCGTTAPGTDKGCGNKATRWIGFVDSSATARVKQVLVIVGDDDQGDNGDTERISFIGANVISGSPNVLLVKRITAVNGSTTTNAGDNLANYINEAANPYDDNTIEPSLAPNPPTYPTPDTDKWLNPSTFLVGGINGGAVQPRDTLEYTIYFLSTGAQAAKNVRFCDRVPENVTFVGTAFGNSPDRGIVVNRGGTITNLTNVPDTDAGHYFAPGSDPATVYPGINCGGANTNGAVVVNLGDLPFATGQGVPSQSYGFIRFRGIVK